MRTLTSISWQGCSYSLTERNLSGKLSNQPAVAGGSTKPRVERSGTLGYGVG
jgi:hypothetical protein